MALEFKSFKDDAWFDARVITEGRRNCRLRIKFFNFGDEEDEVIHAKQLKSLDEVDALRSRFRKISSQFQDNDCSRVEPGLLVCAARPVGVNDMKFYDAVLTGVVHKQHRVSESGEEMCTCSFNLEWVESGGAGSCSVENICWVQNGTDEELDPVLISFLNKAREDIQRASSTLLRLRGQHSRHKKDRVPSMASIAMGRSFEGMGMDPDPLRFSYEVAHDTEKLHEDTSTQKGSLGLSCYTEGMGGNASDMDGLDDMDVGGTLYMVIVENLEKEISPFTITEFIQQQVSIACQASVSASKSSELYTRAIILLESKENLEKLSDFLESPHHIIISSTGRPWFVTEKTALPKTLRASIQTFMILSQMPLEKRNELNVVLSGSREYMEAKELQIMFKEFIKHQCGLHRRLHFEEGNISQKYRRMV